MREGVREGGREERREGVRDGVREGGQEERREGVNEGDQIAVEGENLLLR